MKEFIIFETFMFLGHKDLLNVCVVNKSFNKVYNDYYEHINEFYDEVNDVQDDLIERARDEISNKQGEDSGEKES